jgi:histidinol-phosphate aminotransferase
MRKSTTFTSLANPYLNEVKPYVPGLTSREAAERYHIPPDKLIKLSSNENPLGPPPLAVQAAQQMLSELHRYPDSKAVALRRLIAEIEGLTPENVIIGAGSSEVMSFVIRAFSQPGDEVVSMDPSFTVYAELATADGRRPVFIPLDHPFNLNLKDVKAVLSDRTRVLFITRPNNPTSRLIPLDLFEAIAQMVPNAVVVSDEAYIEFADGYREQTARCLIDQADNVIVTRTFSKAYGIPNLRVGYGLGPAEAINFLFRIKPKWNVGEIAQQSAIGALRDRDHFEKVLRTVREGRRYLCDRLAQISGLQIVPEPQGNFIMVRVRGVGYSAEAFTEALGAEGIIIRGDFHPDYVRISIGTQAENAALVKAIYKIIERS